MINQSKQPEIQTFFISHHEKFFSFFFMKKKRDKKTDSLLSFSYFLELKKKMFSFLKHEKLISCGFEVNLVEI